MFRQFRALEWKAFLRSSAFTANLISKIIFIIGILYFSVAFLVLGIAAYFILEESFPNEDPLKLICRYLILWWVADLIFRYFLQNLPVLNVQSLLIQPIKRTTIVRYIMRKVLLSFSNLLPFFLFIPLSIELLIEGYGVQSVLWLLSMASIVFCNNFIGFWLKKNSKFFYIFLGFIVIAFALYWFNIIPVLNYTEAIFYGFYKYYLLFLIPIVLFVIGYFVTQKYINENLYLDDILKKKNSHIQDIKLNFLDRFGVFAVFLKNDIRMVLRNKRPRATLLTSFFLLFYGILISAYDMSPAITPLACTIITGGFLMTFGQLVPAWDSEYYKLLMTQNISYHAYLGAKWRLMIFMTLVTFILATPYIYYGKSFYFLIVAATVYNLSINSFLTLWSGALNRKAINLNGKSKFGQSQDFNLVQLLISIPKMLLPTILYIIPNYIFKNEFAGFIGMTLPAMISLFFHKPILNKITKIYIKEKYKTIAAFSEK